MGTEKSVDDLIVTATSSLTESAHGLVDMLELPTQLYKFAAGILHSSRFCCTQVQVKIRLELFRYHCRVCMILSVCGT